MLFPLLSQVLFRSGVLNQLEAKRDELLSDRIIQLQAFSRGYLARRRVNQRRVQVSNELTIDLLRILMTTFPFPGIGRSLHPA